MEIVHDFLQSGARCGAIGNDVIFKESFFQDERIFKIAKGLFFMEDITQKD